MVQSTICFVGLPFKGVAAGHKSTTCLVRFICRGDAVEQKSTIYLVGLLCRERDAGHKSTTYLVVFSWRKWAAEHINTISLVWSSCGRWVEGCSLVQNLLLSSFLEKFLIDYNYKVWLALLKQFLLWVMVYVFYTSLSIYILVLLIGFIYKSVKMCRSAYICRKYRFFMTDF